MNQTPQVVCEQACSTHPPEGFLETAPTEVRHGKNWLSHVSPFIPTAPFLSTSTSRPAAAMSGIQVNWARCQAEDARGC